MLSLTTSLEGLPGVGSRRAEDLRRIGLRCVADLLLHIPLRYERELEERSIDDATEAAAQTGATVTARGTVATTRIQRGRRMRFEAVIEDGGGRLLLTWFNAPWMRDKLHPGETIRVWGKAKPYGDAVQMVNPRWERIDEAEEADAAPRDAKLRPVYSASESIASTRIERLIDSVLDEAVALLDDHLGDAYRQERGLPRLADAYTMLHRPNDEDDVSAARRRLAFDELLMLQLGVMLKRRHRRETLRAPALPRNEVIDAHIVGRFPFALTDDQREVVDEIAADLALDTPMNRLLQGDVGAGKTVVALYAMLLAVTSRKQAALMAPTELLAEQHHASITRMLAGADVSIVLLTGSLPAPIRRERLQRLVDGEVDLVIGTHALLTESVEFNDLALVIVDEQHRFGVHQRATLRNKTGEEEAAPHTLVMTATPIPRTLSLTVFGDLDVSTIRHLPPGRTPITTRVVSSDESGSVYGFVAERLAAGDQAYIVVPVIDESQAGLTDVTSHLEHLRRGPLAAHRLEAMHGRLDRDERDAIMSRFRDGEIDAIVATTVIEVGVDVPNATLMVIEHADRFGLAQLHQLRGRVGRGSKKSVCVLIADPTTDDGRARIAAIASTADGFRIAEKDLEIRGPGELFGAKQSGMPPFRVASFPRDLELLQLARRDAEAWIERTPLLDAEEDALLRRRLLKAHGQWLGLADVG